MAETGLRVLIVEDEPLIAMMVEDFLDLLGHRAAGTADRVEAALELVRGGAFDLAIVDVNLSRGEQAWPVADALAAAGKPFILATGSGGEDIEPRHQDRPVLFKPFTLDGIEKALASLG